MSIMNKKLSFLLIFQFVLLTSLMNIPFAFATTNRERMIEIERDHLMLSDLYANVPKGMDQIIGATPKPGQTFTLDTSDLIRVAQAYGISYMPITSDESITIHRPGAIISGEDIHDQMVIALREKGVPGNFDLDFRVPLNDINVASAKNKNPLIKNVSYDPSTQVFSGIVTAKGTKLNHMITGRVDPLIDIVVAKGTIQKGTSITNADIELKPIRQSLIRGTPYTDLSAFDDLMTRRSIPAGSPITTNDVQIPLSIKRGDKVTLLYKTSAFELTAQGRAMQDGRTGDRIKIVNTDSNKNLQGTIVSRGQVEID